MPAYNKDFYEFSYKITSFDCDRERRLRQSAQMRVQQEAGELHLLAAGYPYVRLYDEFGFFFIITRIKSRIHRSPLFGEDVTVRTWSMGQKSAQYIRNFEFRDKQGNILIESSGSYAALDAKTGKLLRPKVFTELNILTHRDVEVSCGTPGRLTIPGILEPLGVREIRYSDVDYNGHLNNTVYPDFLADYIPGGIAEKRISEFMIQFQGEAVEGDKISISGTLINNQLYLEGTLERGKCFTACAIVEKK